MTEQTGNIRTAQSTKWAPANASGGDLRRELEHWRAWRAMFRGFEKLDPLKIVNVRISLTVGVLVRAATLAAQQGKSGTFISLVE